MVSGWRWRSPSTPYVVGLAGVGAIQSTFPRRTNNASLMAYLLRPVRLFVAAGLRSLLRLEVDAVGLGFEGPCVLAERACGIGRREERGRNGRRQSGATPPRERRIGAERVGGGSERIRPSLGRRPSVGRVTAPDGTQRGE